ncbi:MAG: DUF3006 domain-containing protein [Oscillospiraceae bacterium]|jgi:hypothetical protein|nr:DUF3006 domain-containing protein [Oscillospiraceae bacterium]
MIYSIDRFEGDWAVCEDENRKKIDLPRSMFPPEARETDCFTLDEQNRVVLDPFETERRKARSMRLQKLLFKKNQLSQ